jgi:hypothetical protein
MFAILLKLRSICLPRHQPLAIVRSASTVLFHIQASVANAVNHLRKDMMVDSDTFEIHSQT